MIHIENLHNIPGVVVHTGKTAILEVGHFYIDPKGHESKDNDAVHQMGIQVGMSVYKDLHALGIYTTTMLFVDDFHTQNPSSPENTSNTVATKLAEYEQLGFTPDVLIMETILTNNALSLVEKLNPKWIKKKQGKVCYKSFKPNGEYAGNFTLIDETGNPSCVLLDAALYIKKWSIINEQGVCITVLPIDYFDQQYQTKEVLRKAGYNIPILNVYFDLSGKLSVDFDY